MIEPKLKELIDGIRTGDIVPYLGPAALRGSSHKETAQPIPADSDSLILAMNNGKPMAPRLMYEFPRAAMDVELKRGRGAVNRFLDATYGNQAWSRAPLHEWLAEIKPPYVIDINRDTQLQESYAETPHTLIRGISRVGGTDYRFRIHHYDGASYTSEEIDQSEVDTSLPILFKPMGSPSPDATYIASDADYVDYITEMMGGFAIPDFLKRYRKGKQYLFLGLRMTRDTERMVLSDIIYAAGTPSGWAMIPEPNDKERRFCKKMNIEIIEADIDDLLAADGVPVGLSQSDPLSAHEVGC
ncbi:MAG: SIR2 family protein [Candidatus Thiodiazotropha sp.]